MGDMRNSCMKSLIIFGVDVKKSIIRMILLTVMNLYGIVNILVMEIVICVIINTLYHPPKSLVLYLAG